jgi:hypothetical protein
MDIRMVAIYLLGLMHGMLSYDFFVGLVYVIIGLIVCYGFSAPLNKYYDKI